MQLGRLLSLGLATAAFVSANAAHAGEVDRAGAAAVPEQWNTQVDFDLARDCRPEIEVQGLSAHPRERRRQDPASWKVESIASELKRLRPRWSHELHSDGPVFEFGTLGAGRKHTPKLAHIALGWDF